MKRLVAAAAAVAALLSASPAFAALDEGANAPDFTAKGMLAGQEFDFKLSDALKKGPVVVYFFPAAYTPGCTAETKLFADAADAFKAEGATLIGVTGMAKMADGSMASASESLTRLAEFSKEHCRDKFQIAAVDPATIKAFSVTLGGKDGISDRTSYVIGQDGKIDLAYTAMSPDQHVSKTLETVREIKAHAGHTGH
ncbi:MAG: redoxin domain-containing protein [Hyphomonadaceae bacterium]